MKQFLQYNLVLLFFVAALSTSCSKSFLDEKPSDSVASGDAINSAADMQVALTGVYSKLLTVYGAPMPIVGDLLADNTFVSAASSGVYNQFNGYNFTSNVAYTNTIWSVLYQAILGSNNI